ncbi:MAG: PIN domain-containing protein [Acidobacteriota bacterium]
MLRKFSSADEAVQALQKLKLLTRILPMDQKTVEMALASSFSDFEDALHYYAAMSHDLDAIITRSIRDYKPAKLPVLSAEECVQMLQQASD